MSACIENDTVCDTQIHRGQHEASRANRTSFFADLVDWRKKNTIAEGLQSVFAEWREKESADVLLGRRVADWTVCTAVEGWLHILPVWEYACDFTVLMENLTQQHLYLTWHQTKRKLILELFCTDCMQPTHRDMDIVLCSPDTDVFFCFSVTLSRYRLFMDTEVGSYMPQKKTRHQTLTHNFPKC